MEEKKRARGASTSPRRQVLDDELIAGRLMAHGTARYQFRRDGDSSYYMKVLTQHGERTVWGKDLKRAVEASVTKVAVGDVVGLRRTSRERVTLASHHAGDASGRKPQETHQVWRNRWEVEKVTFFAERARLARQLRDEQRDAGAGWQRPELSSTLLTLRAAREFAEKRVKDPKDQQRFMSLVKEAIEDSGRRAELMATVKLRQDAMTVAEHGAKTKERTR